MASESRAELDKEIASTAGRQESIFRRQLEQLHKFVDIQQQLTGFHPLTNEIAEKPEAQKQAESFENRLTPLLDATGSISGSDKVAAFLKLMQADGNASSRKLLIMVLGKTKEKTPCLARFVKADGLAVLSAWLTEAMQGAKTVLIMQISKLLPSLPVTLNSLKESGIGKTVNKIGKSKREGDTDIKECVRADTAQYAAQRFTGARNSPSNIPRRDASRGGLCVCVFGRGGREAPVASCTRDSERRDLGMVKCAATIGPETFVGVRSN